MKLTVIRLLIIACLVPEPEEAFADRSALSAPFEADVLAFEPIFICLLTLRSGDQLRVKL